MDEYPDIPYPLVRRQPWEYTVNVWKVAHSLDYFENWVCKEVR